MRSRVRLGAHAPGARKVGGRADKDHGVAKLSRPEPEDNRQVTDTQPKQAETAAAYAAACKAKTRSPGRKNLFAAHSTIAPVVTAKSP